MGGANLFEVLPVGLNIKGSESFIRSIQSYGIVSEMIQDFEREITNSNMTSEEKALYLKCLPGICRALSPHNSIKGWEQTKAEITATDLLTLEHAEVILRRYIDEIELEASLFGEFYQAIDDALEILNEAGLPIELKDFIASQLLRVKQAVDQYKYRGMNGVHEALASYLGSLDMSAANIEKNVSAEGKTKLRNVLTMANSLFAAAHDVAWAWSHVLPVVEVIRGSLGI